MPEYTGWLLDLYADPQDGLVLWLIDAENGMRRRLCQRFPVTFYAAGPGPRLRALWRFLSDHPTAPQLTRTERRDLFQAEPVTVLAVQVEKPSEQPRLFAQTAAEFPDLTYYDTDLPLPLRHAACYHTFPLVHCRVAVDANDEILEIQALDSPWDLDPETPPLRILSLEPDCDPFHAQPRELVLRTRRAEYRLALDPPRPLLVNLHAILRRHDPDLLLTNWGDTWGLPYLIKLASRLKLPLPLNRDAGHGPAYRAEHTYYSYGQVIHRGRQVHLFGRWHIDGHNAMLFHDYGLQGVLELARVTSLSAQTVARTSPGSGISAMQMRTALQQEVLVPWHKQQAEDPKTALELLRTDQGGLVYQPTIGLHRAVGAIDFISMYPSVMVHFNISPETVGIQRPNTRRIPALDLYIDQEHTGLVPATLSPLLEKRVALKTRLVTLPAWDPRRRRYEACSSAHKWLLVTCFGYLGYRNARFGRIEAHEAVTAYGREALLRAKEVAEDLGFRVLHMYVDGLWVQKEGSEQPVDFQPVLDEIVARTGLPVALDGIHRWIAFLPSRLDTRVPVANRYFGVFQNGALKVRGIEARRRDTPRFIAALQREILELLAQAPEARDLPACLPAVFSRLRHCLFELRHGRIPLEELQVAQKLSRALEEYRSPSPAARAALQLASVGKHLRAGQCVRFIYTRGEPGVHAWDLPQLPNPAEVDVAYYTELLVRAASSVLQPLGVDEAALRLRLLGNAAALQLFDPCQPPLPPWGIASQSLSRLVAAPPVPPPESAMAVQVGSV